MRADSDDDGLLDSIEDTNRNGQLDPAETDPINADTDEDGILDGVEDVNRNGRVDPTESSPLLFDSDGDGLSDADEDRDMNGRRSMDETDPTDADSDDGIAMGSRFSGTSLFVQTQTEMACSTPTKIKIKMAL